MIDTSAVGDGFPDLVCARAGVLRLVEVKDGAKWKSRQRLTPDEQRVSDSLAAAGIVVVIISNVDQVGSLR